MIETKSEKKAMEAIDKAVWEALGFGDGWFPPDLPTQGPGWSACHFLDSPITHPKDWNHWTTFPPVSRDWNLAMWAAEKAGLWSEGYILRQGGMSEEWEVSEINWGLGFTDELAQHESGLIAICKAILAHKKADSE